ncbi:hypothetical protein [Actomonas aquatica]|uniref:Uncharacterized protein n=1 Tax=Actomonas aquatica TaxID=2866162 RepID=A0ABZ1CCI6_9BACT|nr:hypothetical protein [Opitutus sp. WL0086]WRQ89383.1 hypothetical protein K1X11_008175 [Opitutus sp. WL0086]
MIPLPKQTPTEPGCVVRNAGLSADGFQLYQCVLWQDGKCWATLARFYGPASPPTLDELRFFFAGDPARWTPIAPISHA